MKATRNVLWSVSGLGARTIIQVIYFVLLAKVLGPTDYGALSSSLAIIYIFVPYSTWGAGNILVKNVSRDRLKFGEYWGSALLSIIVFGSLFLVVTIGLYFLLLADKVSLFPVILLCLSELLFLRIIDTTVQAYQAFEVMSRTALVQFVFSLIRLLFTFIFIGLVRDHSFNTWAALYLCSTVVAASFCLVLVRIELGKASFSHPHLTDNLREGFYFALSPSSQGIYNNLDKSILPKYVSLGVTGNYSVAYKVIDALCVPLNAMLQTFYARMFIKGADGLAGSRKFAIRLFPVFLAYAVLAVLCVIVFAGYVPKLFGVSYEVAGTMAMLLSPLLVFRAVHTLGADTLTGAGMQGMRSAAQVSVALVNAALCLILIPRDGWLGAVWASLMSDGLLAILILILVFASSQTMPPPRVPLEEMMQLEENGLSDANFV